MNWQKVFKISESEVPKVIWFTLLGAIFNAGLTIGITAGDTFFLTNLGIENLPYIFITMPVIMLMYVSFFSYLIAKIGLKKLIIISAAFVGLTAITFFLLLSSRQMMDATQLSALFFGIKIFTTVIYIAFYSLYWNFADLYFDMTESKRLYAYLACGSAVGVVIGGLLTSFGAVYLGVSTLFLLWAATSFLSIPIIRYISVSFKEIDVQSAESSDNSSVIKLLGQHWGSIIKNRYVRIIAFMVFSVALLASLAEYQYYDIFSSKFDEVALAAELGKLYAIVNVFNLIILLFVFNRLVLRFGVTNTAFIQPVAYIIAFSFLLLQYSYETAVFAFFVYQGLALSVDNNNYNLLYSAFPNDSRAQLRTILEGLIEPLATAAGGLFLLYYASKIPPESISLMGFRVALVLFICALFLKRNYMASIVVNLKTDWLDFSRRIPAILSLVSADQINTIAQRSRDEIQKALFALRLLLHLRPDQALKPALALVERYEPELGFDHTQEAIKTLIQNLIDDKNYDNIIQLLQWFEQQRDLRNTEIMEMIAANRLVQPDRLRLMLNQLEGREAGVALAAMIVSWDLREVDQAVSHLDQLLKGGKEDQLLAIRILGYARNQQYARYLLPMISSSDRDIRSTALVSMRNIVNQQSYTLVQPVISLLPYSDTRQKIICFDILKRISDPICVTPILSLSKVFTPFERRMAEDLLVDMGSMIMPLLVKTCTDTRAHYKARTLAGRVLFRLSPAQFELILYDVIQHEITLTYQFLHNYYILHQSGKYGRFMPLILRFYRDIREIKINFVLELLTTVGRLPSFELIANSLRSANPKTRSYALEALEQGMPKEVYDLLLPLTDKRDIIELINKEALPVKSNCHSLDEVLFSAAKSDYGIEKAAGLGLILEYQTTGCIELLRDSLRNDKSSIVKEAVHDYLFRQPAARSLETIFQKEKEVAENIQTISDHTTEEPTEMLPADEDWSQLARLLFLSDALCFDEARIEELEYLAERSSVVIFNESSSVFEQGDPANAAYVVIDGLVLIPEITSDGNGEDFINEKFCVRGDFFGDDIFKGDSATRTATATTEQAVLLKIDRIDMLNCCRLYPDFTINLLRKELL
ncbi:MAG: cyclic nucleotide-binding domain-containing protein [Balneolales bacterium]|nr:cyclic nucleotide-binding domain-containing protein [Balneolales bacterium]